MSRRKTVPPTPTNERSLDVSISDVEGILVRVARGHLGLTGTQEHRIEWRSDVLGKLHSVRLIFTPLSNVVPIGSAKRRRR